MRPAERRCVDRVLLAAEAMEKWTAWARTLDVERAVATQGSLPVLEKLWRARRDLGVLRARITEVRRIDESRFSSHPRSADLARIIDRDWGVALEPLLNVVARFYRVTPPQQSGAVPN